MAALQREVFATVAYRTVNAAIHKSLDRFVSTCKRPRSDGVSRLCPCMLQSTGMLLGSGRGARVLESHNSA